MSFGYTATESDNIFKREITFVNWDTTDPEVINTFIISAEQEFQERIDSSSQGIQVRFES